MPETYTVYTVKEGGEKPNPHGGTLYRFYVALKDSAGEVHGNPDGNKGIYWQRKSPDLEIGQQVYGHIEDGEYGPRFKTDQKPDGSGNQGSSGGNFQAPTNLKKDLPPDGWEPTSWTQESYGGFMWSPPERGRRIERQHSQEMAIRVIALRAVHTQDVMDWDDGLIQAALVKWTDFFVQDLDADVGGGSTQAIHDAPPVAADVSAENMGATPGVQDAMAEAGMREASPAQKGKLTQLFGKAGLSRDAMKAVVLFRCRSEKATKDGASKLIQDLMDGATHDTLLAEIHDAKRAGDAVAIRAAKLIPSDTPLAPEPEPVVEPNGKDKVPF